MELNKPDFNKAYECACEVLVCAEKIKYFPISVDDLINDMDLRLISYSKAEKELEIPGYLWKSKDAELREILPGVYVIFYNDLIFPKSRILFSIIHEIGHFYMNHDCNALCNLSKSCPDVFHALYNKYELEANFFAAELLMPDIIIKTLIKRGCKLSEDFLIEKFGVSNEAASIKTKLLRKRYEIINRNDSISFDDILLMKFQNFINNISPKRKSNYFLLEDEYEKQRLRDSWQ